MDEEERHDEENGRIQTHGWFLFFLVDGCSETERGLKNDSFTGKCCADNWRLKKLHLVY